MAAAKKRTIDDLYYLFDKCLKQVTDAGIRLSHLSFRLTLFNSKRAIGKYYTASGDIGLNRKLLDKRISDKSVMQAICHEILHGCAGAVGHGAVWKRYAAVMNRRYGYNIARINNADEYLLGPSQKTAKYKYQVVCRRCGRIVAQRQRRCPVIDYPTRYRCGFCGSSNLISMEI